MTYECCCLECCCLGCSCREFCCCGGCSFECVAVSALGMGAVGEGNVAANAVDVQVQVLFIRVLRVLLKCAIAEGAGAVCVYVDTVGVCVYVCMWVLLLCL